MRFLTSRSEPFEAGFIAGGRNYGPPSRIADRPGNGCDTSGVEVEAGEIPDSLPR